MTVAWSTCFEHLEIERLIDFAGFKGASFASNSIKGDANIVAQLNTGLVRRAGK